MIWLNNIKLFWDMNEVYWEIICILIYIVSQDVGDDGKVFSQPIVKEEKKVPIRNSFDKRPLYIPETSMSAHTKSSFELMNNFCIHECLDLRWARNSGEMFDKKFQARYIARVWIIDSSCLSHPLSYLDSTGRSTFLHDRYKVMIWSSREGAKTEAIGYAVCDLAGSTRNVKSCWGDYLSHLSHGWHNIHVCMEPRWRGIPPHKKGERASLSMWELSLPTFERLEVL